MAPPATAAAERYEGAPMPADRTPWRKAPFCVLDFELTGVDPAKHEIISFATVGVDEGVVRMSDSTYRIVRPAEMPEQGTIRIHGLREQDLADAPPLDAVLDELIERITGRVLVAHVAAVEARFLGPALATRGLEVRNPLVDTAALAPELFRLRAEPAIEVVSEEAGGAAVSSPGLSRLARSLGLPAHRPHHADGDALTTAQVFLALATHLEEFGEVTVGSLVRASAPERAQAGGGLQRLIGRLRPS